jgi:lambda family phage portal protein
MSMVNRFIGVFAPGLALRRARNQSALRALMNYDAASAGNRASSWRPKASDADGAAARRARLAYVARDMIRNTPFALRAQQVITNNVIGDGIIWKVKAKDAVFVRDLRATLKRHFDTTAIDADGRSNLYGLQRLVMNAVVDSGEVFIRRRRRARSDGLPLPFQLQIMEADYLDTSKDGPLPDGNLVREGIEFDQIGRRVAYWIFNEHPGSSYPLRGGYASRRVDSSEIIHIYRQDRPGQMRGVSWFAPIALSLQDLGDHQDAQLMRQKVAACFAAFRIPPEDEPAGTDVPELSGSILPGRIQNLAPGEDIKFAAPPGVEGYDEFTRSVLRSVAAGLGVTYEALSGDLSTVNFSSARMGRMEMDRNVSAWQWLMLIPQMMQPLAAWTMEAIAISDVRRSVEGVEIEWTPPHRILVDPAREIGALRDMVKAGFGSRQNVIRTLGFDPEEVLAEQISDKADADGAGLVFDSDGRSAVPMTLPVQGVDDVNNAGGPNGR